MRHLRKTSIIMTSDTTKMDTLREDFPILQTRAHGRPLIYFDNGATSQKPQAVIDTESTYYQSQNANVHRGVYELSQRATQLYEGVREKVCSFIGTKNTREIIYTRGTTESINLVASAWGRKYVRKNDSIIVTRMEHHSNFVPWQSLAIEEGAEFGIVELDKNYRLDLTHLQMLLKKKPKLLAVTLMSNTLGVINPIPKIVEMAKAAGTLVLVDAAQAMIHQKVNVADLGDIDFLAFSAHKMCGPTGVGILWAKENLLSEMNPFLFGGDMIIRVNDHCSVWNELPWKFEAGTPNIAGVIGLGTAIDYLQGIGFESIQAQENKLKLLFLEEIKKIPQVKLVGPESPDNRGAVFSLDVKDIHPHDLATFLDRSGIAVRAGHHCTQPLLAKLKLGATTRASLAFYNTETEVHRFMEALKSAVEFFK